MRALIVLAALAFSSPAFGSAADQLCGAAGYGAGCIGSVSVSSDRPSEQHEPSCDYACRQQAAEDRRYALEHMYRPPAVPSINATLMRFARSVKKRLKQNQDLQLALMGSAIILPTRIVLVGAATTVAVSPPGWVLTAGGALLTVHATMGFVRLYEWTTEQECPAAAGSTPEHPCSSITDAWCDGLEDCNELRRRRDRARECADLREAELAACGKADAADERYARFKTHASGDAGCDGIFRRRVKDYGVHDICDQDRSCKALRPPQDCDEIQRRRAINQNCLDARRKVSAECYTGAEDKRDHPGQERNVLDVLHGCAALASACLN